MYLRTLSGLVAGFASIALVTTAFAAPAIAAEPTPTITRADAAEFVAAHGEGRFVAADAELDEFFLQLESLSSVLCQAIGADSSLVLLDIEESQQVASLLVSADVDTDGVDGRDSTCTYAMLVTDEGLTFNGSYTLDVSSSLDPVTRRTALLSEDIALTEPVFTDIEQFAAATLTATGQTLQPATRWVNTKVSKAKTAKQKKAAKKKYQAAVKSAKKKYAKAGKTSKAKKVMTKSISRAKKAYKKAIAPSTRTVRKKQSYTLKKPFALSAILNGADDVRGL